MDIGLWMVVNLGEGVCCFGVLRVVCEMGFVPGGWVGEWGGWRDGCSSVI